MAVTSFPFVSTDGDRKVTASEEAEGARLLVVSGVAVGYMDELMPSKEQDTLNVFVAAGGAVIAGRRYLQDAAEELTLDAGGAKPRYDVVALEANNNTPVRAVRLVVLKGAAADSPAVPSLTRTDAIYQIELARVLIPTGAVNLNGATLTDTREFAVGRHTHAAGAISSGTLAVANGGTGAATAGAARIALGAAAAVHNHAAGDVTSGTLPIERGGTGGTTAALARAALSAEETLTSDRKRKITVSTSAPTGGEDGDIWVKVI